MANFNDTASMALFCDFENIALGVRDAQYEKFDIRPVLERLLAKGSIVVKKAYCDWDRYKAFKSAMHEANFELIEIPHVRQSGKNSADIRMVVDALDLCYTKAHVDTFVIISGDSDFSPLVSKLRENAKKVIGVGVKQSCSDLLVTNCDEFIYYDDLVRDREAVRASQRREREKRTPEEEARRKEKQEERKAKAVDIVHATFVDLIADRGDSDRIWASVLKEVVKRRNPGFNENYFGFRTFGNLLEEAAGRNLLGFGRDDKGAFVFRAPARAVNGEGESTVSEFPMTELEPVGVLPASAEGEMPPASAAVEAVSAEAMSSESGEARSNGRRRTGRRTGRQRDPVKVSEPIGGEDPLGASAFSGHSEPATTVGVPEAALVSASAPQEETLAASEKPRRTARKARKSETKTVAVGETTGETIALVTALAPTEPEILSVEPASETKKAKAPRRTTRSPRTRKPKASEG